MIKYFVLRNFRGTCSSVEMPKGYMVTKRLGTSALGGRVCMLRVKAVVPLLVFDTDIRPKLNYTVRGIHGRN